ncbi:MAG TPA: FliG C-terminal domain-containing protein [Candidatus Eisenbacteria bacterium]|nr:FliG C-terminal domain-containing protein [Candidatus Eisenbacteria bacterium]
MKRDSAGARRVAVLLASLDVESGRAMLREFPAPDRQKVLIEVARLEVDPPSREEMESTLREFHSIRESPPEAGQGGRDVAKALAGAEGDPEERRRLLERIEAAVESIPFGFLAKAGPARLAEALRDEHPQTLALIAACLPPGQSAQLIDRLPLRTQVEAVRRLATLEPMSSETVERIEKALESRFDAKREAGSPSPGGFKSAASVLSRALPETRNHVLAALDADEPGLADQLRESLLTFDDLAAVDDRDLALIASEVEIKTLAAALKSSAPEFAARLFRVLSPAESALLAGTLESMGPATLQEITDARREISRAARRLVSGRMS